MVKCRLFSIILPPISLTRPRQERTRMNKTVEIRPPCFLIELEGTELMDVRRAAFRDRIPAELDIIGIEIPAGSRGWLLQDSIAACIVQKRVTGIARNAEVIAQSDLRGDRRCRAKLRIPNDEIAQYSHGVTHIISIGGAPREPDADFAIPIRREIGIHKSIVIIPNLPLRDLAGV